MEVEELPKLIKEEEVAKENGTEHIEEVKIEPKPEEVSPTKNQREAEKKEFQETLEKQKWSRLKFLLEKTSLYSNFLSEKISHPEMDPEKSKQEGISVPQAKAAEPKPPAKDDSNKRKRKKATGTKEDNTTKKGKYDASVGFQQPKLVTGGQMRNYQLKGTEWLISLYENGLNGILADEMGLGKTIQCISLFAHLIENNVPGPFLVVGPLSTLANWKREVERWCPSIGVLLYHGEKKERLDSCLKKLNKTKKDHSFPIVVTSYEIIIKDRKYLGKFNWKYIVVDEGHRIKNLNCKLIQELKKFHSANRLLLSGTPLQNNLSELWSLLNFLLPDIFDDLESFQSWFDLDLNSTDSDKKIMDKEQRDNVVTKLHQILRPFLLRRVKAHVELDLPKKQERIVSTSLSPLQQKYYKAILERRLPEIISEQAWQQLKHRGSSLQNMVMQLRKCCNHPYLFQWPLDEKGEEKIDEELIHSSGKMQLLDRLLPKLKKEGHKVLLFSQFTRTLDILEDYMHLRSFSYHRLDGSTPQPDREEAIQSFQTKDDVFCFLLSTRAGGLGINLTKADTVIFYDSDWNPQMDLQAQDRCHRIGQTKHVRIYRMATANSIESRILEKASMKRKLEQLVIQKGNFVGVRSKSAIADISELAELLKSETPNLAGNAETISDDWLFKWNFDDEELNQQQGSTGGGLLDDMETESAPTDNHELDELSEED